MTLFTIHTHDAVCIIVLRLEDARLKRALDLVLTASDANEFATMSAYSAAMSDLLVGTEFDVLQRSCLRKLKDACGEDLYTTEYLCKNAIEWPSSRKTEGLYRSGLQVGAFLPTNHEGRK